MLHVWHCRDTAGQERFHTITTSYYRGAMGIMLVYDITNAKSFDNIAKWLRNIDEVSKGCLSKVLIGKSLKPFILLIPHRFIQNSVLCLIIKTWLLALLQHSFSAHLYRQVWHKLLNCIPLLYPWPCWPFFSINMLEPCSYQTLKS